MAGEKSARLQRENEFDPEGRILDLFPFPIALWNRDFTSGYLNESGRRLVGLIESNVLDLGSGWTSRVHPDDRDRYVAFRKQLAKEKSRGLCDYRILRGDSPSSIWIREVSAFGDARIPCPWEIRSVYTEVSDLKSGPSISPQRDMTKTLHELENQVHVLSMAVELAGRGLEKNVELRQFVTIVNSINRSVQDLRNCLGSWEVRFGLHDPVDILAEVLSDAQPNLNRRRIAVRFLRRRAGAMVGGEKKYLRNAFENVIEVCASLLRDGGELEIEAETQETGGQVFTEINFTATIAASSELSENLGWQRLATQMKEEYVVSSLTLAREIVRRYRGSITFRRVSMRQARVSVLLKASV